VATSLDIVTTIFLKADKVVNKRNAHQIDSPMKFTKFKCHQLQKYIRKDSAGDSGCQVKRIGCDNDSHESRQDFRKIVKIQVLQGRQHQKSYYDQHRRSYCTGDHYDNGSEKDHQKIAHRCSKCG